MKKQVLLLAAATFSIAAMAQGGGNFQPHTWRKVKTHSRKKIDSAFKLEPAKLAQVDGIFYNRSGIWQKMEELRAGGGQWTVMPWWLPVRRWWMKGIKIKSGAYWRADENMERTNWTYHKAAKRWRRRKELMIVQRWIRIAGSSRHFGGAFAGKSVSQTWLPSLKKSPLENGAANKPE